MLAETMLLVELIGTQLGRLLKVTPSDVLTLPADIPAALSWVRQAASPKAGVQPAVPSKNFLFKASSSADITAAAGNHVAS